MNNKGLNSGAYWEGRFKEGWDLKGGAKQSLFFGGVAMELLPVWFKRYLKNPTRTFLDWGCAEGYGTNVLHKKFPDLKITGIDFSDSAIEKAATTFKDVEFKAIDLLKVDDYRKKYDVVFSSNVLEHFRDPWKVFEGISSYANDFVVAMVPFREPVKNRTVEHFYSFTPDNIPARIGDWSLIHLSVRNTDQMANTRWAGEQALIMFAKSSVIEGLKLSASDMNLLVQDKDAGAAQRKEMEEKIVSMQEQLDDNWRIMNSLRHRVANRVIVATHRVFPVRQAKAGLRKAGQLVEKIYRELDARQLARIAKKHRGIIVHTGIPWDEVLRQRPHHISPRLAAGGYLFVYVDPEAEEGPKRWITDSLLVVGGYDVLDKLSAMRGKMPMYYISIAGFPSSFDELMAFKDKGYKIIYEYIDELDASINGDLSKQLGVFKRLESLKPVLVIASAKGLYDEMVKRFSKNKVLLSKNAVETEKFQPYERAVSDAPEDIRAIVGEGKPIVGYYGAIASWLDYELINNMVMERPEYNFVFIGRDYDDGLKNLHLPKNMHYLGPKDYKDLSSYSYWFDCAIIPFKKGEIAKSTSPLKLFEYMAMGIPTVCTRDLRECSGYEGVLMSKDNKQFISNMDKAIILKKDKNVRDTLIKYAAANTWDARANDILAALKRMEK